MREESQQIEDKYSDKKIRRRDDLCGCGKRDCTRSTNGKSEDLML